MMSPMIFFSRGDVDVGVYCSYGYYGYAIPVLLLFFCIITQTIYGDGGSKWPGYHEVFSNDEGSLSAAPSFLNFSGSTTTWNVSTVEQTILVSCDATRQSPPGFITTVFLANGAFAFGCSLAHVEAIGTGSATGSATVLSNNYVKKRTYFLSVAISRANFPNVPIWVANRDRPVSDNATLAANSVGGILLIDADGSVAWDSHTANISGIHLAPNGNLVFLDAQGSMLWQSFDEPIDVLVPGQSLKPNRSLVSGFSSVSQPLIVGMRPPTGNFTADMKPGGLVLYEHSGSTQPLPYYAIKYPFVPSTLEDTLFSPCNHSQLLLTQSNLTLIQVQQGSYDTPLPPYCGTPIFISSNGADGNNTSSTSTVIDNPSVSSSSLPDSGIAFVRLDADGNIRAYHHDFKPSFDLFESTSKKGLCGIPNACGPYGICFLQTSGQSLTNVPAAGIAGCQCPTSNQSDGTGMASIFTEVEGIKEYLLTTTTCTLREVVNIQANYNVCTTSHKFFDVEDVDYFANDYINASLICDSFDICKAACASNCTCRAAFYRAVSRQCFLHENVLSMIHVPTFGAYRASIKYWQELSSEEQKKSETKLIVGISISSVASIAFLVIWRMYKGRQPKLVMDAAGDAADQDMQLLASLPGQPRRFSFKELRAATCEFRCKLGVGGFGSVYRGMLPDGSLVAVKQLEFHATNKTTQAGLKEFRNEVIALSNINHQNLVHLRGFCADGPHRLLVYEFMLNGSLDTWLFQSSQPAAAAANGNKNQQEKVSRWAHQNDRILDSSNIVVPSSNSFKDQHQLDWKTRLSITIHTARGLFFLHEQCRNPIVHLDIKPQNILLDDNFVAKLSDFGLSRLINEDQSSAVTRMRGTPGYMAPECLILTDATEKSDVYSFGMVLLEIVSGRKNVDVSRLVLYGDGEGWYFPAMAAKKLQEGCINDIIDKNLRQGHVDNVVDQLILEQAKRVVQIAFWCIQDEPALRPTMGKVLLMLEGYTPVPPPPMSNFNFGMLFHRSINMQHQHHHQRKEAENNNSGTCITSPSSGCSSTTQYTADTSNKYLDSASTNLHSPSTHMLKTPVSDNLARGESESGLVSD